MTKYKAPSGRSTDCYAQVEYPPICGRFNEEWASGSCSDRTGRYALVLEIAPTEPDVDSFMLRILSNKNNMKKDKAY